VLLTQKISDADCAAELDWNLASKYELSHFES